MDELGDGVGEAFAFFGLGDADSSGAGEAFFFFGGADGDEVGEGVGDFFFAAVEVVVFFFRCGVGVGVEKISLSV